MNREAQIQAFLARTDWADAKRSALGQDASFRRYWRLEQHGDTAMLMDAPPPEKPVSLFARIARFLRDHNLYAPEIYALDKASGLMLIEDFGEQTFTRLLANDPTEETALYELATDTLCRLHRVPAPLELTLGTYDLNSLISEAALFTAWFYPAISGQALSDAQSMAFKRAWQRSIAPLADHRQVLVLRDYHVDNLMRVTLPGGTTQCGLLDFQDALIGSPAYDLMSLLEDARRDISAGLKQHCLDRYFMQMANFDPHFPSADILTPWLNVLAAQRHAKVLGIFVRLCQRDHKPLYLRHLPRVLALYRHAIEREPCLAPIAQWMAENLPFNAINLHKLNTLSA